MNRENLQSILTLKESKENEERKKKLTDLILSEQAILVVGAGSSAQLGYPTWNELIDELEELAERCDNNFHKDKNKKETNPLEYVEEIKSYINKKDGCLHKYNDKIFKLYKPRKYPNFTEFHKYLVNLPFKGIITTNYDDVLESALMNIFQDSRNNIRPLLVKENMAKPVSEFLLSFDFKKYPKRVAHLHGHYEDPETIILSIRDYIKFYGLRPEEKGTKLKENTPSWSFHRKILWSILATRRSVWIGFSMNDPFLNKMLEMVSSDLWRWDESIHYAIMDINREKADDIKNKAKSLKSNYGVEVVFYENDNGNYNGLTRIIIEVYEEYNKLQIPKRKKTEAEDKTRQIQNFSQKKLQESSDWLDTINKRMEESININED